MEIKDFKISWLKNKLILSSLKEFIENLIQKKGQDIIAMLLFGSLAQDKATFSDDYRSDIDLLIISKNLLKEIIPRKLYTAKLSKSLGCGIHQIWNTPEEINKSIDTHRAFYMEIIKYGRILYEQDKFLTNLKNKTETILRERGIRELEHIWLWPQDSPGSEIEW
jgi:predicted nucleotidyltransferase